MAGPAIRLCCDVSRELMDAIAREDWTVVKNILSVSSRHVGDSVVTQLISEDQWSAVRRVIECSGGKDRTWDIEGIVVKGSILLSVAKRDWTCLKESPNKRFPDSTFQWIIRQVCTRATKSDVVQFVLPHCADDRLDSVLTIVVKRRQWQALGVVLKKKGVSDSNKRWAVQEVYKQCEGYELKSLIQNILPHCADYKLDSVLTTLVERRQWQAVGDLLERGVRDSTKQWAVHQVCKHCKNEDFGMFDFRCRFYDQLVEQFLIRDILPYCAVDQVFIVLTRLVQRRLWQAVVVVLEKKGVSDSNKQWAVQEACKHCKENDELVFLIQNILPHCADDHADSIKQWAVQEACKLDSVLITLVERRLWLAVLYVLERGVSDSNKQWAVQETCKHCEGYVLESLIQNILPHCADDQLNSVLTTLVERHLWHAVGVILEKKGVSDLKKQWAVQEACKHCKDYQFESLIQNILPHCADGQLFSLLTTLVECRLWQVVGVVLKKKGVSDLNKQWAVQEACKQCKDDQLVSLIENILPHCADDQRFSVLTTLAERRLWQAVLYVLKRGVSDSSKRWVVLEVCACCESVSQEQKLSDILFFCADDQADCVLTTLVERRLWHAVVVVLEKKGVSDSNKQWAVQVACKHCTENQLVFLIQNILPHCADDQLDSVLTTLVERLQWTSSGEMLKIVVELLKQGVSETVGTRAVEETWKAASRHDFIKYVLPHCPLSHLNSVMPNFVKEGDLTTVDIVMQRHRKDMEIKSFVLPRWYVDVLPSFVEHRLWNYVQEILHSVVKKSLYHWSKREGEINEDDSVVWAIVNTCRVNVTRAVRLFKAVKEKTASIVGELYERLGLTEDLCELLYTSFVDQVCVALCSEGEKTDIMTDSLSCHVHDIYTEIISSIQTISMNSVECMVGHFKSKARKLTPSSKLSSISAHHFLIFLKQFNLYYNFKRRDDDDELLLMMFAVLPLSPVLQSVALRFMLRHKKWDVISQADLSGVWEQDRRHLLQAAVKQRQWSVVKRWADHTLYDDQRVWALNEALNEKQWDVALLLADHGLTDIDLMRVHYRLAKYADWDVILHMFERGADMEEVKERLGRMKDNKRISERSQHCINDRHSQVKTLEKTSQQQNVDALENACHRGNWIFVLFTLIRNPSEESVRCALKEAMKKKAWHVVMQLIRLGMDAKQRHLLFSRMLKRRQWGVCRVLLEQGLSVQLCLKVLPKLMDMNQWTLVARVMEHEVGDDVRQQVMQRAWERREGSVVWLCIKSLPTPLSVEEREALFQRAFSCELWQVIKPLVEVKDETGIRHRDTALLEAIEQHQWDLVDHCQWHHADINMKNDVGHTPLQRAAMKKDWEAVEELVVRDGDPNLLDREGYTVLHRAIEEKQWDIVNLLIQYHADIHKTYNSDVGGVTPLRMLIDNKRADMIELSLLWCPDQAKGVNRKGETPLHVSCVAGSYDSIYYLIARGVPPLAVTNAGQSGLVYAVLNKDCPQRMVAECIRLGFSTHQPKLTKIETDQTCLMPHYLHGRLTWLEENRITSPFLCAVLHSVPGLMQMLYESGTCSQREMFRLYKQVYILADTTTKERRKVHALAGHQKSKYENFDRCIADALPYLTEIATTPRSLESTCRLVISHCLTLSKTRHTDVYQLPLTERMKNFVLFSDLTDPDFGKDTT